jgi:hypothetical protein
MDTIHLHRCRYIRRGSVWFCEVLQLAACLVAVLWCDSDEQIIHGPWRLEAPGDASRGFNDLQTPPFANSSRLDKDEVFILLSNFGQ